MTKTEQYDSSWDTNTDDDGEAFDKKYEEWEERDWKPWLQKHLTFPIHVIRKEDTDDACSVDSAVTNPFRLGHEMHVLGIETDHGLYGIIVQVKKEDHIGSVPLCDLGVLSVADPNYWPVREYVVWYADR